VVRSAEIEGRWLTLLLPRHRRDRLPLARVAWGGRVDGFSYWQAAKDHGFYQDNRAFQQIASEAAQVGRDRQLSPDDFEWGIHHLFEAYGSFLYAMNPMKLDMEDRDLRAWHNHYRDARLGKKHGEPSISSDVLSGAAYEYLKGPLRVPTFDRALIDALIAQETFAYIDSRAGSGAVFTQAGCFVVWLVLWGLGEAFFGHSNWTGIGRGVAVIVAIALVIWAWPWKGSHALHRAMKDTYQLLTGSVISVAELRRRVEQARDKGVVWPAELYAVLDDVEARTKVL